MHAPFLYITPWGSFKRCLLYGYTFTFNDLSRYVYFNNLVLVGFKNHGIWCWAGFLAFCAINFCSPQISTKIHHKCYNILKKRKHETWCRYRYLLHPNNSFVLCFCHNPQLLGLWGVRDFPPWEFAGGCYYGAMGMKVTWQQQQEFLEDLRAARSLKSALWKI